MFNSLATRKDKFNKKNSVKKNDWKKGIIII